MDYEQAYKDSYNQYMKYKAVYLQEALEKEIESLSKDFGVSYISDEQYEDIILPFWKKYNKKPKKIWFDVFGSRDRIVDPRFLPSDLYINEIIPYLNNLQMRLAIADKCTYDFRLKNIKQPKTICKCMAGFYYDKNMNLITREEAIKECLNYDGQMVIKPSINSSSSRNVYVIDPAKVRESDIDILFNKIGSYFIVQSKILQHKDLSKLNPDTVNTIRVNSLLTENGEVYIPHLLIRVGGPKQQIVEQGNGNFGVEIEKNGSLNKKMLINNVEFYKNKVGEECVSNKMSWQETPNFATAEAGYKIPSLDKLYEAIKEAHKLLPYFRWIGWDFTIDIFGDPVLIEYNLVPGYHGSQLAVCKPAFGEMTEEILDKCYILNNK